MRGLFHRVSRNKTTAFDARLYKKSAGKSIITSLRRSVGSNVHRSELIAMPCGQRFARIGSGRVSEILQQLSPIASSGSVLPWPRGGFSCTIFCGSEELVECISGVKRQPDSNGQIRWYRCIRQV